MSEFRAAADRALHDELRRLTQDQQLVALDTRWQVLAEPTPAEVELANLPVGTVMFALYTSPPPTVTLYSGPIERERMNLREVIRHELEHRLGYDHQLDRIVQPCGVQVVPRAPAVGHNDACPVCRMHRHLAEADRLAAGLAIASQQQGRIPLGLGGTVPLMRRELAQARALVPDLETMLPDRRGELRSLQGSIGRSLQGIEGTVDPSRAQDAARTIHESWWAAYQLAWSHFAARHGR